MILSVICISSGKPKTLKFDSLRHSQSFVRCKASSQRTNQTSRPGRRGHRGDRNQSGLDLKLVGSHKIVFEFFRLDGTGELKISARVAGIKEQALYHEFFGIARGFGCPLPRKTRQTSSQSVAVWPSQGSRGRFSRSVAGYTPADIYMERSPFGPVASQSV